ncbi:MAG: hypothetical protein HZB26_09165 [Candidatus Hydrogenedentes bacterium]|nr:hypothetical protein [Candidatus Hydrogenedentota bacterium]
MKIRTALRLRGLAVASALLFALSASAQDDFHARVSFDAGGTLIKGSDPSDDWSHATTNTLVLGGDTLWVDQGGTSELEMAGGAFLRMADGSKAEVTALPPGATFRAHTGSFYVHRLERSSGEFAVMTPACTVAVGKASEVRIDITGRGATCVSVRWGRATVRVEGAGAETASDNQRIYVDPGMLPSDPEPFSVSAEDDFDQWNRERTAALVQSYKTVPPDVQVRDTTVGVGDLAPYGEWVHIESRSYWRPTVVREYVPYRTGHWSYVPAVGYVWVEEYPFSYVTTHYGRWVYNPHYGWVWGYDPVWSPAWCATVHYGNNLLWSPIGFDNRPVVMTTSATFNVGGVLFSIGASSFVPADAVYYGGPVIRPVVPAVIHNVPTTQINIWNITVNNYNNPVRVPYIAKDMPLRQFSPRAMARGPVTFGRLAMKASERAQTLEEKAPLRQFVPPAKVDAAAVRTRIKPAQQAAPLRSVRIQPEQRVARTAQGAAIQAKPLAKPAGEQAPLKPDAAPVTTAAPDKGRKPDEKIDPRRTGAGQATRNRGAAGKQGEPPVKTGPTTAPVVTDTPKETPTGADKLKGPRTSTDRTPKPLVDSGPGKTKGPGAATDRTPKPVTETVPDKAKGPRATIDRTPKPAGDVGIDKTKTPRGTTGRTTDQTIDSRTGKTKTPATGGPPEARRSVEQNVNKPVTVEKTPADQTQGPVKTESPANVGRRTTVRPEGTRTPVKTGPPPDQRTTIDPAKGKTAPSKIAPDTGARGKATGADKNKKKKTGKPGEVTLDDSDAPR